ncbi:hypothetical protein K504DRAFT_434035 [Pleomassaria siparia CBS 279.74]|uniref:RNase III domain-containing protein n=1 Tax=Pleomassaria siparia CBS 279.74 TaxID=1314801 RepID=A0A6G1K8D1_9PLEO|nr:hypothetical protein K504DRAFT_434035 [Pleomassaria siparia CBS 279.74]
MTSTDLRISRAESSLGYVYENKLLAAEAIQMGAPITHLVVGGIYRPVGNNKRLALVGETALANALCKLWYEAHDSLGGPQPLAAWDALRKDVLGNANVARRGEEICIETCIIMSNGNCGLASAKMIATTLQALVGAVYLDGGEAAVMHVVDNLGFVQHPTLRVMLKSPPILFRADAPPLTNMPTGTTSGTCLKQ